MYNKFLKLVKKHKLKANSYYTSNPYDLIKGKYNKYELVLLERWGARTAKGHYGISLGQPTPEVFFKFLIDFLQLVESVNPEFEIIHIRIHYGKVQISLQNITKETQKCLDEIEGLLYDKFLIY